MIPTTVTDNSKDLAIIASAGIIRYLLLRLVGVDLGDYCKIFFRDLYIAILVAINDALHYSEALHRRLHAGARRR